MSARVQGRVTLPDGVLVTLTITMSVEEWRVVQAALGEGTKWDYRLDALRTAIRDISHSVTEKFEADAEVPPCSAE